MITKKKLSEEEKDCLVPFVDGIEVGRNAFYEASEMLHDVRERLWEKLKEMYPMATKLNHPPDGDWTITVCDENKE